MFVPDRLAEYVRDEHFRGLSVSNQRRIVTMLWAWAMPRYKHKYSTELASFHSDWLQRLWGNLRTTRSVLEARYFRVVPGSNVEHFTNGYKPYRLLAEALVDFLLDDQPCALRDAKGRAQERPRGPFRSRVVTALDRDGKPAYSTRNWTAIPRGSGQRFHEDLDSDSTTIWTPIREGFGWSLIDRAACG